MTTPDTLMDLIRQMFPPNLIQATMQQYRTSLIYPAGGVQNETGKPFRDPGDLSTWAFKGEWSNGSNILGLVFFAIILGVALAKLGEKGKPLLNFFTSLADAMMVRNDQIIISGIKMIIMSGDHYLGHQPGSNWSFLPDRRAGGSRSEIVQIIGNSPTRCWGWATLGRC